MSEKNYLSLNEYLHGRFGRKLYKAALSCRVTCPNRDGTAGTGGCIFCSNEGSGDFAADAELSIYDQIEQAKKRISKKIDINSPDRFLIAYFQSFTSTYAPVEYLTSVFYDAINHPQTAVLSVATRPDCLPEDVLDLLAELNRIKPVWVELGLQTSNEKTAALINRCYPNEVYEKSVRELKKRGIEVITHVILGLPGESREDMLSTVRYACNNGTNGIKLQLLHVLKGTKLADMEYTPLSLDEYADIVSDCITLLPPDVVVHRLTGDGDRKKLIAPLWSTDKKNVLNTINRRISEKWSIKNDESP